MLGDYYSSYYRGDMRDSLISRKGFFIMGHSPFILSARMNMEHPTSHVVAASVPSMSLAIMDWMIHITIPARNNNHPNISRRFFIGEYYHDDNKSCSLKMGS